MIRTYFRLRPGEPRNLELALGGSASKPGDKKSYLAVKWKGTEIGRFADLNSVFQGQVFTLDDGGQLSVSLARSGWGMPYRILLSGVPIADRGVQDGFDVEASQLGSSCWFLILWPFIGTAFLALIRGLGLMESGIASALGMQGKGAIPWNVFLPQLINHRFNLKPFGEIPFGTLALGMICLGAVFLILSRLVRQRKGWAIYPGVLIHLGVAVSGVIIAIVTGGAADWNMRFGMNADMFVSLICGVLLGMIFLIFAVLSLHDLNSIQRYKTGK